MNNQKFNQAYGFLPTDIPGVDTLVQLAMDMQWSWNHSADKLWQHLDPSLWDLTHNPWVVLQTVSRDQLERQLAEPAFIRQMDLLTKSRTADMAKPAWFQQNHPDSPLTHVAYFSMEFMLNEALPIYVGGLGNVAGDQLKSASDLGVPVAGVGLLYQQGYFRQAFDKNGRQQELFPYNDPGQLPIMPLRLPNGEWLRVKVSLPGYPVWLRAWHVQGGRVSLYLLDSNDAANLPVHRGITNELYGGGTEVRIKQEILLGIGGWKLLRALGIRPEVCHLNEGHAAFVVLERANDYMRETGVPFATALAVTRSGNLFTTHTAVAAGFDHFPPSLVEQYLGLYARDELKIDFNELMALGRQDPGNPSENFNMAYLAIRGSGAVNAVSQLHQKVSQQLFAPLFPRWPAAEIPVGYVTNGVHMPSWDSEYADELWTIACGKERWKGALQSLETNISHLPDETLWQLRTVSRNNLIRYARERLERQLTISGLPGEVIETAKQVLDPQALTLGFARRFVPYKRPNLLLKDPARLIRILTNTERPVQLLIAGKAPPFDEPGKDLIHEWLEFIHQNHLYHHVVFLSDYDMYLTEQMVQGVDVWINTPRRPWEACGTSGMKVLVNGGINLSELDGWWAEAYTPEVGWALGDGREHPQDSSWDAVEAESLYQLLEQQVIPEFYTRDDKGIPIRWIQRMRQSMATLTPRFSANRTVREYTEKYYLPAAATYRQRSAGKGQMGIRMHAVELELAAKWNKIMMGELKMEPTQSGFLFDLPVFLNGIDQRYIVVEVYAEAMPESVPERIPMQLVAASEPEHRFHYRAEVSTSRPPTDYTPRIICSYEGISVPLENRHILWQR